MTERQQETATLTVEEAAQVLGIGRGAAYIAVNTGEIPSIRIGRRILVPKAQLDKMLAGEERVDISNGGATEKDEARA